MEKLSRTKKYEELRNNLENDRESNLSTPELSNIINNLDNNVVEEMNTNENNEMINENKADIFDDINFEQDLTEKMESKENIVKGNDDFLNDFINEVNSYNKSQGLLNSDDVQEKLINSIRGVDDETSANKVDTTLEDEFDFLKTLDSSETDFNNTISLEIEKILKGISKDEPDLEDPIVPIMADDNLEDKIGVDAVETQVEVADTESFETVEVNSDDLVQNKETEVEKEVVETVETNEADSDETQMVDPLKIIEKENQETVLKTEGKVIEETNTATLMNNTISVEVDHTSIIGGSEEEAKPNNILNIILVVLIVLLVAVLAVIGYWILKVKGIV